MTTSNEDVAEGEAVAARKPAEAAPEEVAGDADRGREAVHARRGRARPWPRRRRASGRRRRLCGAATGSSDVVQAAGAQEDRSSQVAEGRCAVADRLRRDAQAALARGAPDAAATSAVAAMTTRAPRWSAGEIPGLASGSPSAALRRRHDLTGNRVAQGMGVGGTACSLMRAL